MAEITIKNLNTQEQIKLTVSHYEAQFLADLVAGSWVYRGWDYYSPDTYPKRQMEDR